MTTTATTPSDEWHTVRGQRMIPDPDTGELHPYMRVSTFAKQLDQVGVLGHWMAWRAILGAQKNPEALSRVLRAEKTPKKSVDELIETGGGRDAANKGTARHQLLAMALQAQPLPDMPRQARDELDAIVSLVLGLGTPVAIEARTVNDEYRTAGSCDLVLRTPAQKTIVAEFKTSGAWRAENQLSAGIQLAAHARSRYWDGTQRGPWVSEDKPRLVVIHAPQDGTPPKVRNIDTDAAMRWASLAAQVRAARQEAKA